MLNFNKKIVSYIRDETRFSQEKKGSLTPSQTSVFPLGRSRGEWQWKGGGPPNIGQRLPTIRA